MNVCWFIVIIGCVFGSSDAFTCPDGTYGPYDDMCYCTVSGAGKYKPEDNSFCDSVDVQATTTAGVIDTIDTKKALLIIDVQKCFLPNGTLPVADGDAVIPVINNLRNSGFFDVIIRSQDWHPENHVSFASNHDGKNAFDQITLAWTAAPILCNSDMYGDDSKLTCTEDEIAHTVQQTLWPDHCVQNTDDAKFGVGLQTSDTDIIIQKGMDPTVDYYSAFYDNRDLNPTTLPKILEDSGVTDVYVVGLALDYCVFHSSQSAKKLGYKTYVIQDATRGISEDTINSAIRTMEEAGITIMESTHILPDVQCSTKEECGEKGYCKNNKCVGWCLTEGTITNGVTDYSEENSACIMCDQSIRSDCAQCAAGYSLTQNQNGIYICEQDTASSQSPSMPPIVAPSARPTVNPSVTPSKSPSLTPLVGTIALEVEVNGGNVDNSNKDAVCGEIASKANGRATYCSLDGPKPKRRALNEQSLFMEIGFTSTSNLGEAQKNMGSPEFISELDLPSEVSVVSITATGSVATVYNLELKCGTSDFNSGRISDLIAAFANASSAEAAEVTVSFDETNSLDVVNFLYSGDDSEVFEKTSLLSFENELNAELLSEEFFHDCFGLTNCEDDPEGLGELVGIVVENESCAVIGSIFFVSFGTQACDEQVFLEKCPVTCGLCSCSAKDCNNRGQTDDNNYADGCECVCNPGFMGDNCEFEFSFAPTQMPSSEPSISMPSRSPSLAPSCYEYLPNVLGNTDLHISAADSGFDGTDFKIAMYVPNIYEILSLSFFGSDLAKYQGESNPGSWIETPIPCLRIWSTIMDYDTFMGVTTFERHNDRFCSKIDVNMYENHHANRDIKYQMPWCVNVATEMRVAVSIDVNIDEPGFLHISRSQAIMHPDHYNNNAALVLEFSTQVVFPWVLDDAFSWFDTTNIVPDSTTLVETKRECNSRDYCWQDWRLEFRMDSVCLRIFKLHLLMMATYEDETKQVAVKGEVLPEASCGVSIDDISTPLSGEILLSPDPSDFSEETQLYRYHIKETVYGQITINDNPAPITQVAVSQVTFTQNENSFDQGFTDVAASGNQIVISMDLNEPVVGTIPGVITTMTADVTVTYGDGTVRRRILQTDVENEDLPDETSVSSTFIVQTPGCLAPEGNAGEVLRSTCRVGDSAEIRLCERGRWRLLGESCPEAPLIIQSKDAADSQTASSSKDYTWEIIFFAVLLFAILVLGYISYKCCCVKPQQQHTKVLQTVVVA